MSDRRPAAVFPPGMFIQEALEGRGWTQEDLAQILGKPLPTVNQLIKGKRAIIAETAQKLAAAFGNSAQFWMNLETAWQLFRKRAEDPTVYDRVRDRARIYELAPIREMERRGWIRKSHGMEGAERELKRFYSVEDLKELPRFLARTRASVHGEYEEMTPAQWAWCQRACQIAKSVSATRFVPARLGDVVQELKALMSEPEEARRVARVLSDFGIRLVVVEHLRGTRIDGAALLPDSKTPVIAISLRYGRMDHFWFTLLHELAHIVHGDGIRADFGILDPYDAVEVEEQRANESASRWLIEREVFESFVMRTSPLYSAPRIMNFARRIGVHPSIVIGQLKFRGELKHNQQTRLHNVDIRGVVRSAAMCDGWGNSAPDW